MFEEVGAERFRRWILGRVRQIALVGSSQRLRVYEDGQSNVKGGRKSVTPLTNKFTNFIICLLLKSIRI